MVGERIQNAVDDREPIWRRIEDRIDNKSHNLRNRPGDRLRKRLPDFEHRNFGGGKAVGAIEAGVALAIDEVVGVPFGSDTEIVDSEPVSGGMKYTINVDAPFENMAEFRAFYEGGTGFTSLLTDTINVSNTEVVKTRVLRDTYQMEIVVED